MKAKMLSWSDETMNKIINALEISRSVTVKALRLDGGFSFICSLAWVVCFVLGVRKLERFGG